MISTLNNSLLYALCMMDAIPCNWNMDFLAMQFARVHPDVYGEIKTTWIALLRNGLIVRVKGYGDRYRISQKGKEFILRAVPVANCGGHSESCKNGPLVSAEELRPVDHSDKVMHARNAVSVSS